VRGLGVPHPNLVTGSKWEGDQTRSLKLMSRLTSFKNSHVRTKQRAQNITENKHGRRYGYSSQNQFPNKTGSLSCGRDSDPPAKGLLDVGENFTRCIVELRTQS